MEQFDNNEIFDDFKPAEEQNSFINYLKEIGINEIWKKELSLANFYLR